MAVRNIDFAGVKCGFIVFAYFNAALHLAPKENSAWSMIFPQMVTFNILETSFILCKNVLSFYLFDNLV